MSEQTKEKVVFESPGGWLQVIETPNKFYYSRRKGRDSVAVFLLDSKLRKVMVRLQPLPRHNADLGQQQTLYPCPITGSIEKDETPLQAATREIKEEAGYDNVELEYVFEYFVGTQTDEKVHLFYGFADSTLDVKGQQDGSYIESVSRNEWVDVDYLNSYSYVACRLFGLIWKLFWK